jgi:hypothetical protein
LETYNRKLPELLTNEGKFVLIHGEEVASVWDTYEDALRAGYAKVGLGPFMVKKIQSAEPVLQFSRDLKPCPTSTPK